MRFCDEDSSDEEPSCETRILTTREAIAAFDTLLCALYLASLLGFAAEHAVVNLDVVRSAALHMPSDKVSRRKSATSGISASLIYVKSGFMLLNVLLLYCVRYGVRSLQRTDLYYEGFWRFRTLRYKCVLFYCRLMLTAHWYTYLFRALRQFILYECTFSLKTTFSYQKTHNFMTSVR